MPKSRLDPRAPSADVAIVGAGLAGLVAARRLAEAGVSPVVLEARPRVGGRLLNEEVGDGKVVEMGGQWIGPTQERMAALAAELGVGTFPTHDEGRHVIEMAGKHTSYTGALADARFGLVRDLSRAISPLALVDFEQARARLDRMARQVPLEEPWTATKATKWDRQTFATWIERNTRTRSARSLFELASGRPSQLTSPYSTFSSTRTPAAASTRWSELAVAPSKTASTAARSGSRC